VKVSELIRILDEQNPDAEVYVYGVSNGHETRTETVNSVVSGNWGPQPYVIISQDGEP
jgi:hypothetical protein